MEADLSAVSARADRMIRVDPDPPGPSYLLHIEFESGGNTAAVPVRALRYNVLGTYEFGLPTVSLIVLLRPTSDNIALTGVLEYPDPEGRIYLSFGYRLFRVWEWDVEDILRGGLTLLPFAPISRVSEGDLPRVIDRMKERIRAEAVGDEAGDLWTATYILMGLRYPKTLGARLLKEVQAMEDSVTYQAIIEKGIEKGIEQGERRGRLIEARHLLLRAGTRRLGTPSAPVLAFLNAITSIEHMETLVDRAYAVESWGELLRETDEPVGMP